MTKTGPAMVHRPEVIMQPGTAMGGMGGPTININVYGAVGQSETRIAMEVEKRLMQKNTLSYFRPRGVR